MELNGARVFITGGAGGIGAALADGFRGAGAAVTTADLPGCGADLDLDVTDREAVATAIKSLDGLDVVVANAGVGVGGLVEEVSLEDWDLAVDVNIGGVVNTVVPAFARLREQGRGHVVLMASLAGLAGLPLLTPYSMTKFAIVGLGASLRAEAARYGVGVTVVCPGPVDTPLLDKQIPSGLTVRRYLTDAAGPALAPQKLAAAVVDGVRRNRPRVVPGRAKTIWRLARWAPNATEKQIARGMAKELRAAGLA
jgi:short-subunit dehydrogenase